MTKLSVLDLATICEGDSPAVALQKSLRLAQRAEALGYERFWMAEHHSMPGVASAATAVVMAHVAAGTHSIRVGAGGIMLPNHAPLVIAEQFGTLESLFPGRIDLGLGRAPGSGAYTQRALRRSRDAADRFVEDVQELQFWFRRPRPGQPVVAIPGAGLDIPLWILGSSLFGATVAADLGLPFAFASHFAPAQIDEAVARYRERFQPSAQRTAPHLMLAVNIVCAERDEDAHHMYSSLQRAYLRLAAGTPAPFPPPSKFDPDGTDRALLDHALSMSVVGGPATVRAGLQRLIDRYQPEELIATVPVFDFEARLRSLELAAGAAQALAVSLQ
ncbi:MAG: LLM class flavin-dependent oxidoreductase [Myxococcales bacterium]|nr:LLM class flavin-dependent oxidoreductase [Myxococcales bacterium]MDD9968197.1 LLM class flavin-dependent oxidoreductase [Myxococcales bacterium]